MEFLKEQLGEELYKQFVDKMKGSDIKLADLSKGEYVAKGKFDTAQTKIDTLEQSAKDTDKRIKELSKVDAKDLQSKLDEAIKKSEELATERDKQKTEYDSKLAEIKRQGMIDAKLTNAKNPRAVKALMDLSKISVDGDNLLGFDEQLKSVKENDSYLFNDNENTGGGGNPANAQQSRGDTDKLDDATYYTEHYNKK